MSYIFKYSDIVTLNIGLKKVFKSGKEFPLLVSKTLYENLERTNSIMKTQSDKIIELRKKYGVYDEINNEYLIKDDCINDFNSEYETLLNSEYKGIEKVYVRDARFTDELKRTNISMEIMENLKLIIE